jgi:hypothetical protein
MARIRTPFGVIDTQGPIFSRPNAGGQNFSVGRTGTDSGDYQRTRRGGPQTYEEGEERIRPESRRPIYEDATDSFIYPGFRTNPDLSTIGNQETEQTPRNVQTGTAQTRGRAALRSMRPQDPGGADRSAGNFDPQVSSGRIGLGFNNPVTGTEMGALDVAGMVAPGPMGIAMSAVNPVRDATGLKGVVNAPPAPQVNTPMFDAVVAAGRRDADQAFGSPGRGVGDSGADSAPGPDYGGQDPDAAQGKDQAPGSGVGDPTPGQGGNPASQGGGGGGTPGSGVGDPGADTGPGPGGYGGSDPDAAQGKGGTPGSGVGDPGAPSGGGYGGGGNDGGGGGGGSNGGSSGASGSSGSSGGGGGGGGVGGATGHGSPGSGTAGGEGGTGGGSGGGGGGRIICTELIRQGYMTKRQRALGLRFFRDHCTETAIRGYHIWARPVVHMMRRDDWMGRATTHAMRALFLPWSRHIGAYYGDGQKTAWGFCCRKILEPFSWCVGHTARIIGVWRDPYDVYTDKYPEV